MQVLGYRQRGDKWEFGGVVGVGQGGGEGVGIDR